MFVFLSTSELIYLFVYLLVFVRVGDYIDRDLFLIPGKPSPDLTHSCPKRIEKGSTLNCTCSSVDMGTPAGSLQWIDTKMEQLVKHYVGPDDDGTQFTCQLSWNGMVVKSLTYTLQLYYYCKFTSP